MVVYYLGPLRSEVVGTIVGVGRLGKNVSIPILDFGITSDQKTHQCHCQDVECSCH